MEDSSESYNKILLWAAHVKIIVCIQSLLRLKNFALFAFSKKLVLTSNMPLSVILNP